MEESARELEETIQKEAAIRKALEEKEAERLDIEEKYSSLQEEAAGKTRLFWNLTKSPNKRMVRLNVGGLIFDH